VRNIATPLAAVILMTVAVEVGRLLTQQFHPLERLVVTVTLGAVTYVFFLLYIDRKLTAEFRAIAFELFAPLRPRAMFRA
jgi:hypothetical protein